MQTMSVRISEGGRIVIPAEYRRQLGLEIGDEVILHLDGQELRLFSRLQGIRRAQEIVRQYSSHRPDGPLASDELIAERRREAERE
jgi:AbrB family looped-hinge helix DNA binding protein